MRTGGAFERIMILLQQIEDSFSSTTGLFWRIIGLVTRPPDPHNHSCSLTGEYISGQHFTYRSAPGPLVLIYDVVVYGHHTVIVWCVLPFHLPDLVPFFLVMRFFFPKIFSQLFFPIFWLNFFFQISANHLSILWFCLMPSLSYHDISITLF